MAHMIPYTNTSLKADARSAQILWGSRVLSPGEVWPLMRGLGF